MRYFQCANLLIIGLLIQGCALSTSLATEAAFTPVTAPTQAGTATSTPTPIPSPTHTVSPTVVNLPPTSTIKVPTLGPATLTPLVLHQSQIVVGLSVGKTVIFTSCAGTNPVEFNGTITTNASATVQYDWLLRGKAYFNSPSQKAFFKSAGTRKVFSVASYRTACGNYTVSLHIISPNHLMVTKIFSIP